jgi:hypothetical protein
MVVRLANQVSRVGAGSATDVMFVIDSDEGEGRRLLKRKEKRRRSLRRCFRGRLQKEAE